MTPLVLTAVSAMLYAAAFPPLSVWPLAWVALVPWLVALSRVTPARGALLGAAWGFMAALGVVSWFPGMVAAYFEQSRAVGWLAFLGATGCMVSVYYAAFGAWTSWIIRRGRGGPLLIACAWCVTEFARARVLVGNPWALIAYSQVPVPEMIQIADLAGPYGIGVVVACVNVAVSSFFASTIWRERTSLGVARVAAFVAVVVAYGDWRLENSFEGTPVRVAVLQGAAPRAYAWDPSHARLGFAPYLALTRRAIEGNAQLVVWPEQAVNFYLQDPSIPKLELLSVLRDFEGTVLIGGARYDGRTPRPVHYNSVFLVRDSTITDAYDKRVLLPLAEERVLGWGDERTNYARGERAEAFDAGFGTVGALLCFEATYPEVARKLVSSGAQLLTNLSNDAWFRNAGAARQHLEMTALRAVENRRFVLRATGMGHSALIDAQGRIMSSTDGDRFGVVTGEALRLDTVTPYQTWGDALAWFAGVMVLTSSAGILRRSHA